jgi:hypothetical protein
MSTHDLDLMITRVMKATEACEVAIENSLKAISESEHALRKAHQSVDELDWFIGRCRDRIASPEPERTSFEPPFDLSGDPAPLSDCCERPDPVAA